MHMRLSVEDLLVAGVPCTSSWFPSTSNRDIGICEPDRGKFFNSVEHGVRRTDLAEETGEVARKRKGNALEVSGEVKKLKVESRLRTVENSRLLLGRLLLWNRTASSHPGSGSNSLDCLAFCDGVSAVCCTVERLDVALVGQQVQVDSWTFVPGVKHREKQCNGRDDSLGSDAVSRVKRTGCYENSKFQDVSGNERVRPYPSDCGGCLEIHSLRLLDQPSIPTAQVLDFPSLCLSPAAANARNVDLESPLEKKGKSKSRLRVLGLLHCISPPFLLPSKSSFHDGDGRYSGGQGSQRALFKDKGSSRVQSDTQSMLGFLVELRSCCHGTSWQLKHRQNDPSASNSTYSQFLEQEVVDPGEGGIVAIYFSGAVASWRPLLGEMLGAFIAITGLRRKMIQLGPERKEFSTYVATRITLIFHIGPTLVDSCNCKIGVRVEICKQYNCSRLLKQPRGCVRHFECLSGPLESTRSSSVRLQPRAGIVPDGELSHLSGQGLRSYVGKITSILMQDQLLELDNKVWLLLTHCKHTLVHGLGVGAMVAVRHAHIMRLRSVSEKVLVLGACLRSHVGVVLHSISDKRVRISPVSQSRLTKYIGSLPFAWAFWVLHVITSLKCKLQGVYSDTELLGSMKHAGLLRRVLPSMTATPSTLRRDAFKEFFFHEESCLLGDSSASIILSKVPPLSNFCKHVEMLWIDHTRNDSDRELGSIMTWFCKPAVKRNSCYVRTIVPGVNLGVLLVGSLKVCRLTGKLQLVDATGSVDVVVPDLRSFSNLLCVYQIAEYELVMEGEYKESVDSVDGNTNEVSSPLSWSSLLKGSVIGDTLSQSLSFYVKFYLRDAKRLDGLTWPSELQNHKTEVKLDLLRTSAVKKDPAEVWNGKEFHVALITHKYPARVKFSPDKERQWAFDVEVVLFPYSLLIHQDDDKCIDSLNLPLQNLEFGSSNVHGAMKFQDNSLEEVGSRETQSQDSVLPPSGCLIDCSMRCLVEESSGHEKSAVQSWRTLPAALLSRDCIEQAAIAGSYCATKENHWATLSEAKLQKVVLAVNWRAVEMSQLLNSGDWCLLPCLEDKSLALDSSEINNEIKRLEIDAKQPLISLQWRYAIEGQLFQADAENLPQTLSSMKGTTLPCDPAESTCLNVLELIEKKEDSLAIQMGRYSDHETAELSKCTLSTQPQFVDAVLIVSDSLGYEFSRWLASLKRRVTPKLLNVGEAVPCQTSSSLPDHGTNLGEICDILNSVKLEASSGTFSLQGEVVSVEGKLETAECVGDPISPHDEGLQELSFSRSSGLAQLKTPLFQLRDRRTDRTIRIDINFDKYVRPVGYGPGAVVCFRRILLQRDANMLVGMPTTDVFIVSVEERARRFSRKRHRLLSQEQEGSAENVTVVDLLNDIICDLEPRKMHLKVHCRLISVQALELEWRIPRPRSEGNFSGGMLSELDDVAVKWGCFIIDDGSAVAECWASGDLAAKLLGLCESAGDLSTLCSSIFALPHYSASPVEQQHALGASLAELLRCLVRKHRRICVQGEPPQGDAGTTSWHIKGADGDLEESEATLLGFFLEQACQRGPKVVHCTIVSDKDLILNNADESHLRQRCSSASRTSTSKPWQSLTWNRTQLVATGVEVLNTWVELQQLATSFDVS